MFLNSPFPIAYGRWKATLIAWLIASLVIWVLQPFGISELKESKHWVILGSNLTTGIMLCVAIYLTPALFPRYHDPARWTLGKQILKYVEIGLLIAVGLWSYSYFLRGWTELSFFVCLLWVAAIVPFPIVFLLMWNRNLLLARDLHELEAINVTLAQRAGEDAPQPEAVGIPLHFKGNSKEELRIDARRLLYVASEGNYINIVYRTEGGGKAQQKLLRATMKQAEEVTAEAPFVIRCHRAFLVNTREVAKVEGNLQGYRLRMSDGETEIPVSRGYTRTVREMLT
jgi:hypothetical protein